MEFDFDAFLHNYRQVNNFVRDNGLEHTVIAPGETTTSMTVLDKHLNSPGVAHGASIAGLMDDVLGTAALTAALVDGNLASTVEFKMNYFKPIFLGDFLVGKGKVIRKGRTLIVSVGEIYRGEELVGQGQGTFNAYPMEKRVKLQKVIEQ